MQQIHIIVSGKVQGVSYRYHAKQEADRLGVNGFIKNLPDGRVDILVEGSENQLHAFLLWCKKGSPRASVRNVEIKEKKQAEGINSFTADEY